MNNPKVSVLMPVYNTKKEYFTEAINSILNQTFTDYEFIILDDLSTNEDTLEVLSHAEELDKRIRVIKGEHKGIGAARNKLMDNAKGEYLAWMDSDDISLPERLEKQVKYLDKHDNVSILGCLHKIINNDNFCIFKRMQRVKYLDMLYQCQIGCQTLIRKKFIDKFFLRYDEKLSTSEDYDFWGKAVRYTEIINLQEVLYLYRILPNSNRHADLELVKNNDRKIKKRMLNFLTDNEDLQQKIYNLVNEYYSSKVKLTFLEKIFSIKNETSYFDKKYKVITILGIKIKIKLNQNK